MTRHEQMVDRVIRGAIVLSGMWALYAQALILTRASFATLRSYAWLPALATVLLLVLISRSDRDGGSLPAEAAHSRILSGRTALWAIVGSVVVSLTFALTDSVTAFWVLAAAFVAALHFVAPTSEVLTNEPQAERSGQEMLAVWALAVTAAVLSLGINRPNPDDAFFLNVAVTAIRFPAEALYSFDGLTRDGIPPVEQAFHLPQTYEFAVAYLSTLLRIPTATTYYVVLPTIWAVVGVLMTWRLLRFLLPSHGALVGTAVFVFLMIAWGDGQRSFGYNGLVRLFQGKAVFLTVVLPFLLLSVIRYRESPSGARWLLLAVTQLAAVGLTTNGVIVAPIAAGLALIAPPWTRASVRTIVTGLSASILCLAPAAALIPRLAPYRGAFALDDVLPQYTTTLGTERTPLVLLALLVIPVLARLRASRRDQWMAGYVSVVILLILSPFASRLASAFLGHVYSWRLLWAVPMPLLLALSAGLVASLPRAWARWSFTALAVWVAAFTFAGTTVVGQFPFSFANIGRLKVDPQLYSAAQTVASLSGPDDLALVPEDLAEYVSRLPNAPRLVGVRYLYLSKLRGIVPDAAFADRRSLFLYSASVPRAIPFEQAVRLMRERALRTIVFPEGHRDAAALEMTLRADGYSILQVQHFVVAVRERPRGSGT